MTNPKNYYIIYHNGIIVCIKENNAVKKIYIVLSSGNSVPKRVYRVLTDCAFDHVSVAFNEKLPVMYSFAKSQLDVALVGGFLAEYPSRFLADGGNIPVKVYGIEVSEQEYMRVREVIRRMMTHPQIYTYNVFDKAASVFGSSFKIKRSYTDLAFICRLLRLGDIRSIKELEFVLDPYLEYEGNFNDRVAEIDGRHGAEYFKKTIPAEAMLRSAAYTIKLLGKKVIQRT